MDTHDLVYGVLIQGLTKSVPPPRWRTLTASLIANHAICSHPLTAKWSLVQLLTKTCLIEGFLLVLSTRSLKNRHYPVPALET